MVRPAWSWSYREKDWRAPLKEEKRKGKPEEWKQGVKGGGEVEKFPSWKLEGEWNRKKINKKKLIGNTDNERSKIKKQWDKNKNEGQIKWDDPKLKAN